MFCVVSNGMFCVFQNLMYASCGKVELLFNIFRYCYLFKYFLHLRFTFVHSYKHYAYIAEKILVINIKKVQEKFQVQYSVFFIQNNNKSEKRSAFLFKEHFVEEVRYIALEIGPVVITPFCNLLTKILSISAVLLSFKVQSIYYYYMFQVSLNPF